MVNERYRIAMAETLHYLKGIRQDDVDKIPNDLIQLFETNASKDYKCEFDYTKPLNEINIKDETRGLISMICLNYWCETEEQKVTFRNHLNVNEQAYQEELKRKYNANNVFKNINIDNNEDIRSENINKLPVELKNENIFKRLLKSLKKYLNRNKNEKL